MRARFGLRLLGRLWACTCAGLLLAPLWGCGGSGGGGGSASGVGDGSYAAETGGTPGAGGSEAGGMSQAGDATTGGGAGGQAGTSDGTQGAGQTGAEGPGLADGAKGVSAIESDGSVAAADPDRMIVDVAARRVYLPFTGWVDEETFWDIYFNTPHFLPGELDVKGLSALGYRNAAAGN